jgi:hypothetical protein
MKKLFFCLTAFLFLSYQSLSAKTALKITSNDTIVIGNVSPGDTTFVPDSNVIRSNIQSYVRANIDQSITFNHVQIIYNTSLAEYFLTASGTNGSNYPVRTAIQLTNVTLGNQTQCLLVSGLTTTCTTSSCASEGTGCVPVLAHCTACGNGGKCTKSVSTGLDLFFSITPSSCH